MGGTESGSEDKLHEKKAEGSPAAGNKPSSEQKHAGKPEQPPKKPGGRAWRRALVPSLCVAGGSVILYAAWRWLRPKDASKKSRPKSTWTLDDTLGPYK
jgi:hypothetical protein